jgi:cytochrome c oxidase assembly protein subunit 11
VVAASVALAMLALGFAAVPLYRVFCQVTGFGGTTMRVSEAQAAEFEATDKTMSIRFDANVERGMPWQFKPVQVTDTVTIGARDMAVYTAKNLSTEPVTGTATFNVQPQAAGKYFSKVQCFCFTEQTLRPGQEMRMPVIYYVDPAILSDPDAKDIEQITLSYTFHPSVNQGAKPLDRVGTGS